MQIWNEMSPLLVQERRETTRGRGGVGHYFRHGLARPRSVRDGGTCATIPLRGYVAYDIPPHYSDVVSRLPYSHFVQCVVAYQYYVQRGGWYNLVFLQST